MGGDLKHEDDRGRIATFIFDVVGLTRVACGGSGLGENAPVNRRLDQGRFAMALKKMPVL
jgi:hypothetical protein